MSLEKHILADLSAGQSTADSIAGRLEKPEEMITTILKRMVKDGILTTTTILDRLTVYKLA
jgi:DNA-binding IscR family transcriptional regulator